MPSPAPAPAAVERAAPDEVRLRGDWTARGVGDVARELAAVAAGRPAAITIDCSRLHALDTIGAWLLRRWLQTLRRRGAVPDLRGLAPNFARMLERVAAPDGPLLPAAAEPPLLERIGRDTIAAAGQAFSLLAFLGETALACAALVRRPRRWRWRALLHEVQTAGFDALPIVGLTSLLLGIVVAYQGADQLRRYGANIFVVDLVGLSVLREFAPLITAIITAGRSGSAYAAQIGTMTVTEEIDALRTLGIAPIDLLVLPKLFALLIALPLLTVYADIAGVLGGMIMARLRLGIGLHDFVDRFPKAVDLAALLIGVGKAFVFAAVIALIGCFQGFRARRSADSVGRQTTASVVQSVFLVIVADALFSIAFSVLGL